MKKIIRLLATSYFVCVGVSVSAQNNSMNPPGAPSSGNGVAPDVNAENQSLEQANAYTFNPLEVQRDPFQAPKNRSGIKLGDPRELQFFDTNQIDLVGIIRDGRKTQAMVVLPNKSSHIIEIGTIIGRRNGRVEKITDSEVLIQESFRDFQNRVRTDQTALVLAQ
jgi:Tfp pilus assembly protein PilP